MSSQQSERRRVAALESRIVALEAREDALRQSLDEYWPRIRDEVSLLRAELREDVTQLRSELQTLRRDAETCRGVCTQQIVDLRISYWRLLAIMVGAGSLGGGLSQMLGQVLTLP